MAERETWWEATAGTTHWSQLRIDPGSEDSRRQAYEYFYERYRGVVYRYLRTKGAAKSEAADLTQDFFARALGRDFLERADPDKGRFRAFLKTSAERFLIDEWRRPRPAPLPSRDEDGAYWGRFEPVSPSASTEEAFDRDWARAVFEAAMSEVERWYAARQRADHFEAFRSRTFGRRTSKAIAAALGLPVSRVDPICSRARARLANAVRRLVAETVGGPDELEEEVAYLVRLLGEAGLPFRETGGEAIE